MQIDEWKCVGCGNCVSVCTMGVISVMDGRSRVNEEECVECNTCYRTLRSKGITVRGLIDCLIAAAVMAVWYIPRRYRGWAVWVLVLGMLGSYKLSDRWFWERMETIVSSQEEREVSSASRLVIWAAAWEMIKANPLGVGVGRWKRRLGTERPEGEQTEGDTLHP